MRAALTFSALTLAALSSIAPAAPAEQPAESREAPAAQSSVPPPPPQVCTLCELSPEELAHRKLEWHDHWRRVGLPEYVAIPALVGTTLMINYLVEPSDKPGWDRPILIDNAVRDALRINSASGRSAATTISDTIFIWEMLQPMVIDTLFVAWWWRDSPDVAWQMFIIDAQAYAMTQMLNDVTKRLTSRARPWVSTGACATDPNGSECGYGEPYRSFYSGHAAMTATSAGLICAHHTQHRLYKKPFLDTGMCLVAVAGTALTGALRIASDNHWTTDVLTGHLLGYASGYLLPTLRYYREFRIEPRDQPPTLTAIPIPFAQDGALGLGVLGIF